MNEISGRRKAGYILGIVVGLQNIPGAFVPSGQTATGSPTGPPLESSSSIWSPGSCSPYCWRWHGGTAVVRSHGRRRC